jgi:hypothetical protein
MMKAHGGAALVALLLGLFAGAGGLATDASAGSEDTDVSYTLSPDHASELDSITANTTVSHGVCFTVTGVELGLSNDAVDIAVHADEGDVCPAITGPFQETLPVPVGLLPVGTYDISVSFQVCRDGLCESVQIGSMFDVVPIGDASCDLQVNSIDANIVLQSAARLIQRPPCATAADTNRDGSVQPTDATLILQYTAGLLDELPPG